MTYIKHFAAMVDTICMESRVKLKDAILNSLHLYCSKGDNIAVQV